VIAGADLGGELAEVGVAGFAPEGEGVLGRDALASGYFLMDVGEGGGGGGHRTILNAGMQLVAGSR
jgi:hypothetical protein